MFSEKLSKTLCLISVLSFLSSSTVLAAPSGGNVTSGSASISQSGSTTNIDQASPKATINWQTFSVGAKETVNFNQPNASAMTLNRVIGNERSVIEGAINANGKVYLVNSNGVLFTGTSQINVGGLVASTLNITDENFMNGNMVFEGSSPASVINQGKISAADGGYVTLLGGEVINSGLIVAQMGTVSMNSGEKIRLNLNGDSLVNVSIDEGTLNALVENQEVIIADGGLVIMTAKAADELVKSQVNNTGIVQAQTLGDIKGEIYINAEGGTAYIAGTLDASAPDNGDGGFIETSGDKVHVADGTVITTLAENGKTGKWLIDPKDFTVASSGADMTGAQLSSNLDTTGVEIQSQNGSEDGKGDIYINDKVEWNADTTLTLTAENDIFINNAIKATGLSAGLVMDYGGDYYILTKASYSGSELDADGIPVAKQDTSGGVYGSITLSGANARLKIDGNEYVLIHSMDDFALINNDPTGYYALANDIISTTTYTTAVYDGSFGGVLTGLGHTIFDLTINAPDGYAALIRATTSGSQIRNIGLENIDITTGNYYNGGLVAQNYASISYAYATGNIYANGSSVGNTGGLTGSTRQAQIEYCFANVDIVIENDSYAPYVGGLTGYAYQTPVLHSHATGNVMGSANVGGLYGYGGEVVDFCFATGNVQTLPLATLSNSYNGAFGGLVGHLTNNSFSSGTASITNSFATGMVNGRVLNGGLLGDFYSYGGTLNIENCYATGDVNGLTLGTASASNAATGGLVGAANRTTIIGAFATGNVHLTASNGGNFGGLVGSLSTDSAIIASYATGNVTTSSSSGSNMGGLVGYLNDSSISDSWASGYTEGTVAVGGLVGYSSRGQISNSFATGNVYGYRQVGGLIGNSLSSSINDSNAHGDVSIFFVVRSDVNGVFTTDAGGLVGSNSGGTITNSSATGSVSGAGGKNVGGLVGNNTSGGSITNSTYTDVKTAEAARVEALKQSTMQQSEIAIPPSYVLRENWDDLETMADNESSAPVGIESYLASSGSGSGSGGGIAWLESGEVSALSLGLRVFSATVKTIIIDDGEEYILEN